MIGARLDLDCGKGDSCRMAFYGRMARILDPTDPKQMAQLQARGRKGRRRAGRERRSRGGKRRERGLGACLPTHISFTWLFLFPLSLSLAHTLSLPLSLLPLLTPTCFSRAPLHSAGLQDQGALRHAYPHAAGRDHGPRQRPREEGDRHFGLRWNEGERGEEGRGVCVRTCSYMYVHGWEEWEECERERERKALQTARPKVGPESQGEELGMPKQEEANGRERGRGELRRPTSTTSSKPSPPSFPFPFLPPCRGTHPVHP